MTDALGAMDAVGVAEEIRSGAVSAVEVVEAAIRRIEDRNGELNAVVADRFDEALTEARSGLAGPLAGVPFLVKDLGAHVAGLAMTRGSRLFAGTVPAADSEVVARYRRAGLVVLGMTNSPELGLNGTTEPVLHGPTRNPWRPTHSSGGSSGGSAAAVASGMVPAAHGNDGGGSIRIPSSMCGLFGLKPSRGLVPTFPVLESFTNPLSTTHALTRSVRDSAALLDAVAGPLAGAPFAGPAVPGRYVDATAMPPPSLRIALTCTARAGIDVDPGCVAAVQRMAAACEQLGHVVTEARPDVDAEEVVRAMSTIMAVRAARAVDLRLAELGRPLEPGDIEPFTQVLVDAGRGTTAATLADALDSCERIARACGRFFEQHDVLLSPTLAVAVPPLGHLDTTRVETMYRRAGAVSAFTSLFNVTGQPAMSIPAGVDSTGMPAGAQFAGRLGDERQLLALAAELEAAVPWPRTAPPGTAVRAG